MASNRTNMQRLLQLAAAESFSFRQNSIDTEHVLLAMMKTGGLETEALTKAGANYTTLRKTPFWLLGQVSKTKSIFLKI